MGIKPVVVGAGNRFFFVCQIALPYVFPYERVLRVNRVNIPFEFLAAHVCQIVFQRNDMNAVREPPQLFGRNGKIRHIVQAVAQILVIRVHVIQPQVGNEQRIVGQFNVPHHLPVVRIRWIKCGIIRLYGSGRCDHSKTQRGCTQGAADAACPAQRFLYSQHKILRAANAVTEFRYRVEDSGIVLYDLIGASPTIGREDGSFGFGVFEYHEDRTMFVNEAKKEISRVKNASGLCLGEGESRNDLIYYSSIPWIDFTDLKHAGKMSKGQSIPRISTGRLVPHEDKLMMPVSVEINHGLADGYHVAQFFRLLDML